MKKTKTKKKTSFYEHNINSKKIMVRIFQVSCVVYMVKQVSD